MTTYINTVLMGQRVRDRHTGFEGTATAYTVFENGCVQWCIEAKEGDKLVTHWFDEQRLEGISERIEPSRVKSGGGHQTEHGGLR